MKRFFAGMTALCLMLCLIGCSAAKPSAGEPANEPAQETTGEPAPSADWYELSEDHTALTVRLPANGTTGYEWSYAIDRPDLLDLLTQEYVPDDPTGTLCGAGGTYCASFIDDYEDTAGVVTLTLTYARSFEDCLPLYTKTITLQVEKGRRLTIKNVTESTTQS